MTIRIGSGSGRTAELASDITPTTPWFREWMLRPLAERESGTVASLSLVCAVGAWLASDTPRPVRTQVVGIWLAVIGGIGSVALSALAFMVYVDIRSFCGSWMGYFDFTCW